MVNRMCQYPNIRFSCSSCYVLITSLGAPPLKMDPNLATALDNINKKLEDIHLEQSEIKQRLLEVEKECAKDKETGHFHSTFLPTASHVTDIYGAASASSRDHHHQQQQQQQQQDHTSGINRRREDDLSPVEAGSSSNTAELQRSYEIIRDSLTKVYLPEDLHVYDSKSGISRECQSTLSVLSKCSRYTETALKQLSVIVDNPEVQRSAVLPDLRKLFTVLQAEVGYLQGEYTGLMVKSKFDDNTTSLFKCFERNQAAFSDQALNHLRCAAEISAISHRQTGRSRGGRGGFSGRGRGSFRQQTDSFQNFTREFPTRRWNNPQSSHRPPAASAGNNED